MEKTVKIAIIDDNTDYLFTMETFLQRNGFETVTAEEGQKGLDLIKKERPDLILLDIMMETFFTGFEVSRKLRTDSDLKDIPIIGISGIGPELRVEKEKSWFIEKYIGKDNFFEKPVDKEKLLSRIKERLKE